MKLYVVIATLVALTTVLVISHSKAYRYGFDTAKVEQLTRNVEAFKTSRGIEDDVSRLGDYNICVELGGLPDDCAKLMPRLDEAAASQ